MTAIEALFFSNVKKIYLGLLDLGELHDGGAYVKGKSAEADGCKHDFPLGSVFEQPRDQQKAYQDCKRDYEVRRVLRPQGINGNRSERKTDGEEEGGEKRKAEGAARFHDFSFHEAT